MKDFNNPYKNRIPREGFKRITMEVVPDDYYLIKCIHPGLGCITGTLGTLWSKLFTELRKRQITDVSKQDEFCTFVANCVILPGDEYEQLCLDASRGRLSNRTAETIVHPTSARADQGTIERAGEQSEKSQTVISTVQSGSGEGRRRGGRKGQKSNVEESHGG